VAGLLTCNWPLRASVIVAPIPVTLTTGQKFNGKVASFADSDPNALPGNFLAVINWGDSSLQSLGFLSGSDGILNVSGNHTYSTSGMFPVTVLLRDASSTGFAQVVETAQVIETASVTSTPEPGSICLVSSGLSALSLLIRRRLPKHSPLQRRSRLLSSLTRLAISTTVTSPPGIFIPPERNPHCF